MKLNKKNMSVLVAALLCIACLVIYGQNIRIPHFLGFGMFGDSYWEVAIADGYVIIDKAIKKLSDIGEDRGVCSFYSEDQ